MDLTNSQYVMCIFDYFSHVPRIHMQLLSKRMYRILELWLYQVRSQRFDLKNLRYSDVWNKKPNKTGNYNIFPTPFQIKKLA
jgi:hypothetical protein